MADGDGLKKYRRRPRPGSRDEVYAERTDDGNWVLYETNSRKKHPCGWLSDVKFKKDYATS